MNPSISVEVIANRAGRSSAYLVRHATSNVLVDCGPGTSLWLDRAGTLDQLDAVVLTHAHADHIADVIGLAYARRFPDPLDRIPMFAPAATLSVLEEFDELFAVPTLPGMGRTIRSAFDLDSLPLDGSGATITNGLELASFAARHAVPSAALRFTSKDHIVSFSSDTCRAAGVVAAADSSDVFVCEATYLHASTAELLGHGHLTPDEAGTIAADAGVGKLLLTHLARPADANQAASAAARTFDPGRIEVATPGSTYFPGTSDPTR